MTERLNIQVICVQTRRLSRTAEYIFRNDSRFTIRPAGASLQSNRKLSEKDLHWADRVMVMETDQRRKIQDLYRHMDLPEIEVMYIPDDYEFMDDELIDLLTDKINRSLESHFAL